MAQRVQIQRRRRRRAEEPQAQSAGPSGPSTAEADELLARIAVLLHAPPSTPAR